MFDCNPSEEDRNRIIIVNAEPLSLVETGDDLVQIVAIQAAIIERQQAEIERLENAIEICEDARLTAESQRDEALAAAYEPHPTPTRLEISSMPPVSYERMVTGPLNEAEYAEMEAQGYFVSWRTVDTMSWLRPSRNGNGSC